MTAVLYGTDDRLVAGFHRALASSNVVVRARTWRELEARYGSASCVVVVIENLTNSLEYQQLVRLVRCGADTPVVLVTARDAESARQLASVSIDEVFWTCEPVESVRNAVARVRERKFRRSVAKHLRSASHLPAVLRAALVKACVSDVPIASVTALSQALGCDRCTLARQWRAAAGAGASLRLQDFLDWVLLIRSVELRATRKTWAAVAEELAVHPHTISRAAVRLVGIPVSGSAAEYRYAVETGLAEAVSATLLASRQQVTFSDPTSHSATSGLGKRLSY